MKRLEMRARFLITDLEPPEVAKVRKGLLHDSSDSSQAAAMSVFGHVTFSEHRLDARGLHLQDGVVKTVTTIAVQCSQRMTELLGERGKHRWHSQVIAEIAGRGVYDQHCALSIDDDVSLTSAFGAIHWAWSGVRPPKTARTLAESITPRL